jgi:hypothetical protein
MNALEFYHRTAALSSFQKKIPLLHKFYIRKDESTLRKWRGFSA